MAAPDIKLISTSNLAGKLANPVQVMKMADAFAALGNKVEVILPGWKRPVPSLHYAPRFGLKNHFRVTFIPSISIRGKFKITTFALGVFLKSRRWEETTVIVTRSERVASFLERSGKKIIYENHTFYYSREKVTAKFRRRVRALMNRTNVAMVVISGRLKELWEEYGIPRDKIFVAHDGVDIDEFRRAGTPAKHEIRTKLGLPNDKAIICYAGSLAKDRGIDLILEAADFYKEKDYLFLIIGGKASEIKRYKSRTLSANVVFTGYLENSIVPLYLRCADLLVMPYQKSVVTIDGCSPMKVFEYLASGNPILAPFFPSYLEVLEGLPGVTLYEPDNPGRFISEIEAILENPDAGKSFDRLVQLEPYSWKNRGRALLEVYSNL